MTAEAGSVSVGVHTRVLRFAGSDQRAQLDLCAKEILPRLRNGSKD